MFTINSILHFIILTKSFVLFTGTANISEISKIAKNMNIFMVAFF